ncbi:hypothetical protein CSW59_19455 [Caulobacter sp. BP25]|nr:hypothetical protein CSW59_19455 [Caulobacter sp. BP25]
MARSAGGGSSAELAPSPSVVSSSRHLPLLGEDLEHATASPCACPRSNLIPTRCCTSTPCGSSGPS